MVFVVYDYAGVLFCLIHGNYFKCDYAGGVCNYANVSFKENKTISTNKLLLHFECCFGGNLFMDALNEGDYGTISKDCSVFSEVLWNGSTIFIIFMRNVFFGNEVKK